jgi:DNA-binding CsgD family transcriptional regulator
MRKLRKLGIITAGTASGPYGPVRENHRHLTHVDGTNPSSCAVNGGFKFPEGEADMRMESAWEVTCPFCGHDRAAPALEAVAKRYSLTTSEARVLEAVLKVNGVRAVAELLGRSQATVKTHLQNLFRKTGTSRQSDLVKRVAGL